MICPKCSYNNTTGAKFCSECGTALSPAGEEGATAHGGDTPPGRIAVRGLDAATIPDPAQALTGDKERGADGGGFDFSPVDEDPDPIFKTYYSPFPERAAAPSDPAAPAAQAYDEALVGPEYAPPAPVWKAGDTMEMPRFGGQKAPAQKEFRAPEEPKGPVRTPEGRARKKRAVAAVIVFLALAALAGAALAYGMELWGGKSVPDVVGMDRGEAEEELGLRGFAVRINEVPSDDREGKVLLCDPGAGGRQAPGSEVVLHIAVSRTVPDVIGMTQEEAAARFADDGLERIEFVTEKSDEAENTVLSLDPAPGSKARASVPITVTLARPYTVPDVQGLSESEALSLLADEGYETSAVYVYSEAAPGSAIASEPEAGSKLASGSLVTVHIAKSRALELVAETASYLKSLTVLKIGGTEYEISAVDEGTISYVGDNMTTCTLTVQAMALLDGEAVYGSQKQKSVTLVWNDSNDVIGIS